METKTLTFAIETKGGPDGPGEFEAILSTDDLDRENEIVVAKALEPLPARIPIDVDHGLKVAHTVGSGVPYYDGNVLKIKGTFASTPLGQEVRTLVSEGHIGHMSVAMAFVKKEKRNDGHTYITKGTLMNAGFTGIPMNPYAAVLSAKSLDLEEKAGARNSARDLERLQATHDHMVELGAQCTMKHANTIIVPPGNYTVSSGAFSIGDTTITGGTALVGTHKSTGQTFVFDMDGHEIGRSVKSSDEDPDVKAAAPAAAESPAPTLMADAYVALAKARMLLLDT